MIVVLKHNPNPEQLQSLITWLQEKGIIIHTSIGEGNMLLGLVGDTSKIDADLISALDIVEDVKRVQEPYKNANRKFHPEDTVVKVGNTQIGGGNLTLMAGPCSVESEEQVVAIAKAVKASGATMLRGGAFKPRTSPYSFQGLGEVGLRYLEIAKEETGLPIVTELMDLSQLLQECGCHSDRRAQYAELRPFEGCGPSGKARDDQARYVRDLRGMADERGVRHGRRQRERHSLRARRAHL